MLGEFSLSEKAIASQGILFAGAASVDASFASSQAGTYIGSGVDEMSAIAVKVSIGSGVLLGSSELSAEFTQSSTPTRFATGISAQVFSFDQSSTGTGVVSGASNQTFNFIQSSSATRTLSGKLDVTSLFEQEAFATRITTGLSQSIFEFYQETAPSVVKNFSAEILSQFGFNQTSGILIYDNDLNVNFAFTVSADGALLWERIDASVPSESWNPVAPSGGSWTEINASGNIETWTQMVV